MRPHSWIPLRMDRFATKWKCIGCEVICYIPRNDINPDDFVYPPPEVLKSDRQDCDEEIVRDVLES